MGRIFRFFFFLRNNQLSLQRDQLRTLQGEYHALQAKYDALLKAHREQEGALVEMAQQLSDKALKVRKIGECAVVG